jgi:hypothetical protein
MNIKETFLELTRRTYPHGFEDELVSFLPENHFKDKHGNYYYKIGESRTAFTCHLDTCSKEQVGIVHVIEGDIIKTDGRSILGADDKAGMTILLYMIEKNVPGLYCFFIGEEVGCIGSGLASKDDMFKNYDRMISFDRKGTTSIITHQSSSRTCSDAFGKQLAKLYNSHGLSMCIDNTGVYTDSAEFTYVIPECTNISVGYYSEHRKEERQDIGHLIKLAHASTKINWEKLVTARDPKVNESLYDRKQKYSSRYVEDWEAELANFQNSKRDNTRHKSYKEKNKGWSIDEWYDQNEKPKTWVLPKNKNVCECLTEHKGPCIPGSVFGHKGRVYYNTLDNDITDSEFFNKKSPSYYETLKQIIYDDRLSARDLERIKDQYLDPNDPQDKEFADYMVGIL